MRRASVIVGAAVLALSLAGCGDDPDPVRPQAVKLTAAKLPKQVHVGLVVSLKAAPGQGSEWTSAAAGAQVASYRFGLGGHRVLLDVVDDQGTTEGAAAAVQELLDKNVSGIVAATEGDHLTGALALAEQADTPVLLPYATATDELGKTAWLTGPSASQAAVATDALVSDQGWRRPVLVKGTGGTPSAVDPTDVIRFDQATSATNVAKKVVAAQKSGADAVVIALPARTSGQIVAALQAANVELPFVLDRAAVSPVFGSSLVRSGGSLSGQLFSVGTDAGDVTALGDDAGARRVAAFFGAVRGASGTVSGLFGQGSFADTAGSADVASHDAVVALVDAVGKAGNASPGKVLAALRTLKLSSGDGLAGAAQDFTQQSTIADGDVRPLAATAQDPGVRPAGVGAGQKLFWFVVPGSTNG